MLRQRFKGGRLAAGFAMVLVAGCSGGNGTEGAPTVTSVGSTTVLVTTTTSRPAPTTTTAPPSPTEDPAALLAAVNEVMAKGPSFLLDFEARIKASAADATDLLVGQATGGQSGLGNVWVTGSLNATNPALTAVLEMDGRTVDGVDYLRNPSTGLWETSSDDGYDVIDAAISGELQLEDVSARDVPGGYLLSGRVPGEPTIELVELLVDEMDLVISQVEVTSAEPRSNFSGLVPPEGGDLHHVERFTARDYGAGVAVAVAPPEGLSTTRWSSEGETFQIHVPKEWAPAPPSVLTELGDPAAAFASEDVVLILVEEDLVEAGVGETTIGDYARFAEGVAVEEGITVEGVDEGTTLQAEPSAILDGADDADFARYRQLLFLHERSLGFRASFLGPRLHMQEAEALMDFILNSFLVAQA